MDHKKPIRTLRIIEFIAVILVLVIVCSSETFAWLKRNRHASFQETGIKVVAGDNLIFELNTNSTDIVNINEVFDMRDFVLKPVSNYSGVSNGFFMINNDIPGSEYFHHITEYESPKQNGFIQFSFNIRGRDADETMPNYQKFVYLNTDSHIVMSESTPAGTSEAWKAIRVSMTVTDTFSGTEQTYVFVPDVDGAPRQHIAINPSRVGTAWEADGLSYWDPDDPTQPRTTLQSGSLLNIENTTNAVCRFSDYDGGERNPERCLFVLGKEETRRITISIWLEGGDEVCGDQIKGAILDFLMKFESFNVAVN